MRYERDRGNMRPAHQLLISDRRGRISTIPHLETAGMKGGHLFRLERRDLIRLPPSSQLFMLPRRIPAAYDPGKRTFAAVRGVYAIAAFLPPGYTTTYNSAYREAGRPRLLPLFSYAAVTARGGGLYAAAVRVDRGTRHDCRYIDRGDVERGIAKIKKALGRNRLVSHLADCALRYGCPNASNFFLSRFEAPLPASPRCNARCAGCISYQGAGRCEPAQPRIEFVPTPGELAEIALFHIAHTKGALVSYGQGCEGEPLLAAGVLEKSIRIIRRATDEGTIHLNTNGSAPPLIARLFDAGLDSIRVSVNSVRREQYDRYYRPRGYTFSDVRMSLRVAREKGGFVSINYLTMPGFTDSLDEFRAP